MTYRIRSASLLFAVAMLIMAGSCVSVAWASGTSSSADAHSARTTVPTATDVVARAGRLPRLLREDFSRSFAVRPAIIVPTGDGSAFISGRNGKQSHIRWQRWNMREAYAVATIWIDNGIPNIAEGTFHGQRATVQAFRVLKGRFTRLTVRYRENGKPRDVGHGPRKRRPRLCVELTISHGRPEHHVGSSREGKLDLSARAARPSLVTWLAITA